MSEQVNMSVLYNDGSPNGFRVISNKQKIAKVYAFPRSLCSEVCQDPRLSDDAQCVYVLWGDGGKPRAYVGQTHNLRQRMMGAHGHYRQKDFWAHAAVYTAGENMEQTEAHYIEAQLIKMAADAGKCKLENGAKPMPRLSNANVKVDAEGHLKFMRQFFFPLAGCDFFNPKDERAAPVKDVPKKAKRAKTAAYQKGDPLFLDARGVQAQGRETDEGFLVNKGAQAVKDETRGLNANQKHLSDLRKTLIDDKILAKSGDKYRLSQDYTFRSPSTAATIILGRSSNGRLEWKNSDGVTLKNLQDVVS